jgi:hypothetical protein
MECVAYSKIAKTIHFRKHGRFCMMNQCYCSDEIDKRIIIQHHVWGTFQ